LEIWQWIVSVSVGIVAVTTVLEKAWRYTRPVAQADKDLKSLAGDVPVLKESVKGLSERVSKVEAHQDSDLRTLRDHAEANRAICNALLALLDHELSGNHTAELEAAKASLTTYLINR
jgi:uncharacterized protein YlxW (UPF0749 family)